MAIMPAEKSDTFYIVRLWDGFDYQWMDITEPLSKPEAEKIWNEKTDNGTKMTRYQDIDYYRIFPADTKMLWRDKTLEV